MLTTGSCTWCQATIAPLPATTIAEAIGRDPRPSLAALLEPYVGQTIGLNIEKPDKASPAKLIRVRLEYFTVEWRGLLVHLPYPAILSITEAPVALVKAGGGGKYPVVLQINQLIVYKGGWSIGFELE